MMQLSIFDLLESVEAEQTCERCGWGHDSPTRCSASLDTEPEKPALDTREIQIKTLENRIAIVQGKVDEIHNYRKYTALRSEYRALLTHGDVWKRTLAHKELSDFCSELPQNQLINFERDTPSSPGFLLDGYKEDLAELKQKLAALTEPEQPARTKPTQDQLKRAILMFLGSGPGFSVSSLAMNFEREPFLFEINKGDLAKAANELCDSGRICKTPKQDGKYKIDELYWIKPGASRALNTGDPEPDGTWVTFEPDLASDFAAFIPKIKSAILNIIGRKYSYDNPAINVAFIKTRLIGELHCDLAEKSLSAVHLITSEFIETIINELIDSGDIEIHEHERDPKCYRISQKSIEPDLASDFDVLFSEPEPELILTPSHEPAVLEPRPLPKPVKADQIGTITPTPEQLKDAVLEILSHQPGFATTEMLRLNLNGAPWCFKVDPPVYVANDPNSGNSELCILLDQMELANQLESFHDFGFGFYGKFWRLPSLSTPKLPEPETSPTEPRCEYCNGHMQPINGNPGQWRCLNSVMHSFYVSNGRGVWVDNSGTFDKQITDVPSWAKKED